MKIRQTQNNVWLYHEIDAITLAWGVKTMKKMFSLYQTYNQLTLKTNFQNVNRKQEATMLIYSHQTPQIICKAWNTQVE